MKVNRNPAGEPTLHGMNQIVTHMHVVMQVHDLGLQSRQSLVTAPRRSEDSPLPCCKVTKMA